jgi:hypothetical protein
MSQYATLLGVYFGVYLRLAKDEGIRKPPCAHFRVSARGQIILILLIAGSLIGVLYLISEPAIYDSYIAKIKITRDNTVIIRENFDGPLNETRVYNPYLVKIVSGDNIPLGNCLAMDESESERGAYIIAPASVADFNVLNVSWDEKLSKRATSTSTAITIAGENVTFVARMYYGYSQDKPVIMFELDYLNQTSPKSPVFYINRVGVNAQLTEWTRYSVVVNWRENVVQFYVDDEMICSAATKSGVHGAQVWVRWEG